MNIVVENFQSLGRVEIKAIGLTVIVGPSDRGKSALVRALEGALFNRAGDQFVRQGQPHAEVTLTFDGHTVVWTKGGGKNRYIIDGVLFDKVGSKVPPVLEALGFREELIGARTVEKESGRFVLDGGEWVRPQIAGQFDRIFLLDRPGTFLSEVIVKLSRLGVLQQAERQCALDLRHARTLLNVLVGNLEEATAQVAVLAPVPALQDRLELLTRQDAVLEARRDRRHSIAYALEKRARVLARLALALPAAHPGRREEVAQLQHQYEELQRAKAAVSLRAQLLTLPKKLPKTHKSIAQLEKQQARYVQLQQLVTRQYVARAAVEATVARVARIAEQRTVAAAALAQFHAEHTTCPVCAQPWTP